MVKLRIGDRAERCTAIERHSSSPRALPFSHRTQSGRPERGRRPEREQARRDYSAAVWSCATPFSFCSTAVPLKKSALLSVYSRYGFSKTQALKSASVIAP